MIIFKNNQVVRKKYADNVLVMERCPVRSPPKNDYDILHVKRRNVRAPT